MIIKSIDMWRESVRLIFHEDKCNGCGICIQVCPKESIVLNPVGASIRERIEKPPIDIDEGKCVICGVCSSLCPEKALEVMINDEKRNLVVEFNAIPQEIKFKGGVDINEEICPKGCNTCEIVCMEDAIRVDESGVELNKEKCTFCGACALVCPSEAITLIRKEIICKKKPKTRLMKRIEDNLLGEVSLDSLIKNEQSK